MEQPLSEELLAMLVCPQIGQALRVARPEELADWTADGGFEGALIREDGRVAYPIRDGFPVLVEAEALIRKVDT